MLCYFSECKANPKSIYMFTHLELFLVSEQIRTLRKIVYFIVYFSVYLIAYVYSPRKELRDSMSNTFSYIIVSVLLCLIKPSLCVIKCKIFTGIKIDPSW